MAYNGNNGTRENLYTNGGEYRCQTNNYPGCGNGPNGTYVGPMHYHPSKGYMAGATHSQQSHPILMPVNGSYNVGGMLTGPSHNNGGIPARVGGSEMIELEGGEYIINAQTAKAVGEGFLNKLNSTATTHHVGGYQQGQLPRPSMYKNGGSVPNRRNKMATRGRSPRYRAATKNRTRTYLNNGYATTRPSLPRKVTRRNSQTGNRRNFAKNQIGGRQVNVNNSMRNTMYRNGGRVQNNMMRPSTRKFANGGNVGGSENYNPCPGYSSAHPDYNYFISSPPKPGSNTVNYFCCATTVMSEFCYEIDDSAFAQNLVVAQTAMDGAVGGGVNNYRRGGRVSYSRGGRVTPRRNSRRR